MTKGVHITNPSVKSTLLRHIVFGAKDAIWFVPNSTIY